MIVTLTPNPSLDRTLGVDRLRHGVVQRASSVAVEPSGKGVNVSRALACNGIGTRAVLPAGGHDGARLLDLLEREGVEHAAVETTGDVRVNVSIVDADGTVTKVNEPGAPLTVAEVAALVDAVVRQAGDAAWVVGSGSLPPGVPEDFYARVCAGVRAAGARFALDTSGVALRCALAAGPDLVKPNLPELAELVGESPASIEEAVAAAEQVRHRTGDPVLVTLGADGALLVDGGEPLHARAPVTRVVSSVGAGDSLLAGYLAAEAGRVDRLREAVAWASAAVRVRGSIGDPITGADRRAVEVREAAVSRDLRLTPDRAAS